VFKKPFRFKLSALVVLAFAATMLSLLHTTPARAAGTIIISEVAPWSSGNSPASLAADWFEVTNNGVTAVDLTGWTVDDNSNSYAVSLPIFGASSIAPGESVIFIETAIDSQAELDNKAAAFKTLWFGSNPPANLHFCGYSGSGVGLSTSGDAVNLFDIGGNVQAHVDFGASSTGTFRTFDNSVGLNNTTISALSATGTNGAFAAANDPNEIGSPGVAPSGTPLVSVTAIDASASEAGSDPGTFRFTRTGSTASTLTATYSIATGAGQATSADYTPSLPGTVTFPVGAAFVDVTITPLDDAIGEGTETVTLTVTDGGSYDVGASPTATVTILDNDALNTAPTAVTLTNTVATLSQATSTAANVRVADITVTDDGQGTNVLGVSGADAAFFTVVGNSLYLKSGTTLSHATKPSYSVTVTVDDTTVGGTPDASTSFTLAISSAVAPGSIIISEVAPWSSTSANSNGIASDWFEVTNIGTTTADITGWKVDDNSHAYASSVPFYGITSIAPGESVIFLETTALNPSELATKAALFRSTWFGSNPPVGLQIGGYSGGGVGLSSTADEVVLFDASGAIVTGVGFGASPGSAPFTTFDNKAGVGGTTLPLPIISTPSAIGVNGAFAAASDANEIGSPGSGVLPPITFLGVAAGDADSTHATLWTRVNQPVTLALTAQVSTNSGFTGTPLTFSLTNNAGSDYTAKTTVSGLTAATTYFYRFVVPVTGETSNTGTFKTAPAPDAAAPLKFAFSGDMDGLMRPYALSSTVPAQNLDFYANLGDVIYETASNSTGNAGTSNLNSAAVNVSGAQPAPSSTGATQAQLFADYYRKYQEQFLAVNTGGQSGLKDFYAGQANYTMYDNHELGNRQYINGGAPAGGPVGGMSSGAGVDARVSTFDVNTSGTFMNQATGFLTLQKAYLDYQPVSDRGTINAPSDPRMNGTKQLYFAQPWGKNSTYFHLDDRTYRDIRMKTSANADDTGSRAANTGRTMLGTTQLAWIKQALLDAQTAGTRWKFIAVSDPIDQLGPIGGALTGTLTSVNSDGGKSWQGGYRAERNALLKFIADNHITNVVFLATDDHQNRINELTYSPTGQTELQSSYVKVPYCFSIVCGPLGATGPETITDHSFANIKSIADSLANAQASAGVEPVGLAGYPGLKNVAREGDPTAATNPTAVDFYSPDTFNYNTLEVSADGKTLTVKSIGINSTAQNSALEYGANGNTARTVFSFQIEADAKPVDSWRLANFGSSDQTGDFANDADYDHDGVKNLIEYALGTNPTSGIGANGSSALPAAIQHDADPLLNDRLAIQFTIPNPNPSDITYVVQSSDDLATWNDIASKTGTADWTWLAGGTAHIVTNSGSGSVTVKIGDSVPSGTDHPKRMMRLKVTTP